MTGLSAAEVVLADGLVDAGGWGGWVGPDAPERFAIHAGAAARGAGPAPVSWVTWRHANRAAVRRVRQGADVAALVRTLDHLVAGHVLAAEAVRAVRPADGVTCEVAPSAVYEVGALLADLLAAPAHGIARPELGPWLAERRAAFNRDVPPPGGTAGRVLRAWAAALVAGERALPRAVTAVYAAAAGLTCGPGAGSSWPRTPPGR